MALLDLCKTFTIDTAHPTVVFKARRLYEISSVKLEDRDIE